MVKLVFSGYNNKHDIIINMCLRFDHLCVANIQKSVAVRKLALSVSFGRGGGLFFLNHLYIGLFVSSHLFMMTPYAFAAVLQSSASV